jgi:hypothetical protein
MDAKPFEDSELWVDLYQKIGRCVVLFQKIELLFKYAVSRGCFSLVLSTDTSNISPIDQLKNNVNSLSQKTMGCVGRLFCDRILTDYVYPPDDKELSKGEMRVNVTINYGTNDQQAALKRKIESIIAERNQLVHQLFNTFGFNTTDDFKRAGLYLDNLFHIAESLYDELSQFAKSIPESLKKIFSNFQNINILNDKYNSPCEKELIVMMQYYAELRLRSKSSDGWVNLAEAGNFISTQCPLALKECKRKQNKRSLKKIIEEYGIFDTKSSGNNKEKILYRMKPECWLEMDSQNQIFLCKKLPDSDGYLKEDLGFSLTNE